MKVLLGVGGGEESAAALERTLDRAAEAGDELTVAVLDDAATVDDPAAVERRVREALESRDVDATIRHLTGDPGGRLVEVADGERFDRLVIGGGERSPMGKIRLGDVTEFVVLNAETTVTLVR